jgi:hypothetical protein
MSAETVPMVGGRLAPWKRISPADVLWSKGISQLCDFKGPNSYWLDPTESRHSESFFLNHYAGASGLVWVRLSTLARDGATCDLDYFVRAALPTIGRPFALITTDGDVSVPTELQASTVKALLECPWLVTWHTQNYDGCAHPKLAPIPIGLDLHSRRPWTSAKRLVRLLHKIRRSRVPVQKLPLRAFGDFTAGLTPERCRALAMLAQCDHVELLTSRLSQSEIWGRYADYPFVVSARGNGLDCHRTWELLYLGCIVITKTSSLDPLFSGLPVVVVEDWKALRDKAKLTEWLQRYGDLTDRDYVWKRLDPRSYLEPIREAVRAATI